MPEERRQYSRIAFHAAAKLLHDVHSVDVVVLDLSLKGALVRLPPDADLAADTFCTLHVRLDDMSTITMDTRVAHVVGRYAGLLCQILDLDSATHLRRLVELNLGDPALLERELSALVGD